MCIVILPWDIYGSRIPLNKYITIETYIELRGERFEFFMKICYIRTKYLYCNFRLMNNLSSLFFLLIIMLDVNEKHYRYAKNHADICTMGL